MWELLKFQNVPAIHNTSLYIKGSIFLLKMLFYEKEELLNDDFSTPPPCIMICSRLQSYFTLHPNLYQMGCIFCRHKITHFHLSKFYIFSQKKREVDGKKWWTYPSGNFSELGSLAVYSISYSLHIHITKKWQKLPASMRSMYFILNRVMKKIQKKILFTNFLILLWLLIWML